MGSGGWGPRVERRRAGGGAGGLFRLFGAPGPCPKVTIRNARNRGASMRSCLVHPCKPSPSVRIAFIAALTLLLSGWTTCSAMIDFNSCQGSVPQPQITALSPGTIPGDAESVLLTVNGSGFAPQSQIMWNGSALQTTFTDSRHLQTTITQQTFDSFGGSAGSSVQISVRSQGSAVVLGCPNGGNSAALVLVIN
jgi:hypothetical protein